ncbi:MAG: translation initiation factor IF-2 [Ignavibacteriales bacterium]|nr:translation initiation factor IF-2 [Ignavibacteriales bacterium]
MSDTAAKKIKVKDVAKDLNISHNDVIAFLTKKGHTSVKTIMSSIDDDMLRDIHAHFKKEKDNAERHQRKIAEMKETRKKTADTKEKDEDDEKKTKHETIKQIERIGEPAVEQEQTQQLEQSIEETKPLMDERGVVKSVEFQQPDREKAEKEEDGSSSPLETLRAGRGTQMRGLTVKGKIELTKPKRLEKKSDKPASQTTSRLSEADELRKKKKKKKKVSSEKGVEPKSSEVETEEEIGKKKKKKGKLRPYEINAVEVQEAIKRTLTDIEGGDTAVSTRAAHRKKRKKEREEQQALQDEAKALEATKLHVTEFVTVGEIANLMKVSASDVIAKCISLGMMVSINQRLDKDTIILLADEFGKQVEFESEFTVDILDDIPDSEETLKPRPPVVTIMGHVDHGKTSMLDYIRNANVVAGEAGGITQHIGAYEVTLPTGKHITFLDTPGHEAFSAMRARGAQLTDIVVLVVAAEDNVMPQTIEAINHAKAANVPIIIAINKVDKPEANPDRIRQQLSEKGVLVEEWGGKYQSVEVSAKTGKSMDILLEKILLEAEILDLKANPDRTGRGAVVEAQVDKGKGTIATVLVQKGTLRIGDAFIAGVYSGKVKAMFDERGNKVEAAPPSTPVQILGFDGIPTAGDQLIALENERVAREISIKRQQLKREQDFRQVRFVTLDDISEQIQAGVKVRELSIVVKGDVDGSVEALADSLMKLSTAEVKVHVIHKGVGAISESDVVLAAASKAIIVGFHVRPNLNARRLAETEKVDIRLYSIIYDAINEIKNALEGLLAPTITEEVVATVEVRDTFKVPKIGLVAGCFVLDGKITRNNKVRLTRDGLTVFEGTLASLRRFKDDVKEVEKGFECGIGLENFNDVKVGDIIEAYKMVETKRKLI